MVIAPGSEGELGILPHHTPLLTGLGRGELRVKRGGIEQALAVFGGFMDVRGDRVIVLTDVAEHADDIDEQRAQAARDQAHRELEIAQSAADEQRARAALQRALVRLRVSEKRRRRASR
ncbi:MAG: ATP synthase F1 subunit epsilon [Chloroflexota bacterium]|nr:ATP synthase F1 subunit epsilon [Chloroflexota bacterium]